MFSGHKKNDAANPLFELINISYGHKNSVKLKKPVDNDGKPVPWYTYPAIDFLKGVDLKNKTIFEYGTGYGTLFWANRCKKIFTVDNNEQWYNLVKNRKNKNIKSYFFEDKVNYSKSISLPGIKFDLIIIDGQFRLSCVNKIGEFLKEGGFLILDNSDWYRRSSRSIRNQGFSQIDFVGPGPINYYQWVTSIFINSKTKLSHIEFGRKRKVLGGQFITPKDEI